MSKYLNEGRARRDMSNDTELGGRIRCINQSWKRVTKHQDVVAVNNLSRYKLLWYEGHNDG